MRKRELTQEYLKELLNYDPETGLFTWKVARSNVVKVGGKAGTLSHGYISINIDKRRYGASQLAFLYMTGSIPKLVDHINLDRADNRWKNLRAADRSINARNRKAAGVSKIIGVYPSKGKWSVRIRDNGTYPSFGCYKNKHDAIMARYAIEVKFGWHQDEINTPAKQYVDEYFGRVKNDG